MIVIGAGPGGYVAAIRAAQLGLKTACVESRETLGGTCLNVGCIPSKALLHASELFEEAAHGTLAKWGIKTSGVELDLDVMHAGRKEAVKGLTGGIEFLFKKNKVTWLKGHAQIHRAERDRRRRHRPIRRRTSSSPPARRSRRFPGVEIDQERIVDSTGALELAKVPGHMVVIGGGVIGLELGSVWRRLGAKVTVVEYLDQILPGMDGEVRKEAAKIFKKQGFEIRTSTKVTGPRRRERASPSPSSRPRAARPRRSRRTWSWSRSAGARTPTGSTSRRPGSSSTSAARSRSTTISAPGSRASTRSATSRPGRCSPTRRRTRGSRSPRSSPARSGSSTTTSSRASSTPIPEIASVGKTEEELKEAGVEIKVGKFPMMANSRAKTNRDTDGFVKVIADARTDRVLGVHIIASVAGTMIAQAAQAMEFGATSEDIAYTCHAHPTHSEAIKEAAMAVTGKPIHI